MLLSMMLWTVWCIRGILFIFLFLIVAVGRTTVDDRINEAARGQIGGQIRPPSLWSHPTPVTKSDIDRMRSDFWDSFVTGNSRTRDNLRMVAELICESNDYETANTILQAADIRTPYGTLEWCYDAQGVEYNIPLYCFSLPSNMISEDEAKRRKRQQAPHKGEPVPLKLKFRICGTSENMEQDVELQFNSNQTVKEVKEQLHKELREGNWDEHKGSPNKWKGKGLLPQRQRLMYQGRELIDEHHLQQAQVQDSVFIQVFIRPV